MAKTANSKVVFVPMQLQSDVVAQVAGGSGSGSHALQNETGEGIGAAGQVGLLNSVSSV